MRRTVLLDLDGTLVDSAPLITEHLAAALAAGGGLRLDPSELRSMVGPPFEESLPPFGLTAEQTATVIQVYREGYDKVAATRTPLFPGIREMLAELRHAGLRLAVATSKPEGTARKIVAGVGLDAEFALVGGADPGSGEIGKAAVIRRVLARLRLDPAREPTLMVGDRHHDVDGAASFGIPTIGVAWGYAAPGELDGAALVVADPAELAAVLTTDSIWRSNASGVTGVPRTIRSNAFG